MFLDCTLDLNYPTSGADTWSHGEKLCYLPAFATITSKTFGLLCNICNV